MLRSLTKYHYITFGPRKYGHGYQASKLLNSDLQMKYVVNKFASHISSKENVHFWRQPEKKDRIFPPKKRYDESRISKKLSFKQGRNFKIALNVSKNLREGIFNKPAYAASVVATRNVQLHFGDSNLESKGESLLNLLEKEKTVLGRKEIMKSLENEELKSIITDIINLSANPERVYPFLQLFEEVCTGRLHNLHDLDMDISSLLYLADCFFHLDYAAAKYLSQLFVLVSTRWESLNLSTENVVQLLFYVAVFRSSPNELMVRIADFLVGHGERLTGREFGLVCHAYFSSNTSFRNFLLLRQIANKVLDDFDNMDLYHIANVMKAFRHSNFQQVDFYEALAEKLCQKYSGTLFHHLDMIHICVTYASVKVVSEKLFSLTSASIEDQLLRYRAGRSGYLMRSKDLVRYAWAAGTLQLPVPELVMNQLLEGTRREVQSHKVQYPEMFVEDVITLAMFDIYPHDVLDYILSPSFIQFKKGRLKTQENQLLLVDSAVGAECPHYEGNTLSEDYKANVSPSSRGDLGKELSTRSGLVTVLCSLQQLVAHPDMVHCHFIMDCSRIADLELHLDAVNTPIRVHESNALANDAPSQVMERLKEKRDRSSDQHSGRSVLSHLLEEKERDNIFFNDERVEPENLHLVPKSRDLTNGRRIVIKVLGWNQYALNQPTLLGIHLMELRLLCSLGYEVFTINPKTAKELENMSADQQMEYVRKNVLEKLKIKF